MEKSKAQHVVLGASAKPERISHQAMGRLLQKGYPTLGVHPLCPVIHGQTCLKSLKEIKEPVHTLTLYVNAAQQESLFKEIIDLKPHRVIFNPGTENPILESELDKQGIEHLKACTLVLLGTDQY